MISFSLPFSFYVFLVYVDAYTRVIPYLYIVCNTMGLGTRNTSISSGKCGSAVEYVSSSGNSPISCVCANE